MVTWCMWLPAVGGSSDVAVVLDKNTLTLPMQAFARGSSDSGSSSSRWWWLGGGKQQRSDGTMFGNRWLPNIATIINQC